MRLRNRRTVRLSFIQNDFAVLMPFAMRRLGPTTQTQFTFAPLRDFPHPVSSVVLSPDHTVVVTTAGDVYTFGLNRFSQLGYPLDAPTPSPFAKSNHQDDPIQSTPRRVVGALKKEVVLGAAASRTHTAVFTADSLYTWGTARGQLGYPIAGNSVQVLPRKVTFIQQPVIQLTATENATACLLESRDVVVLCHEAYVKISFPLTPFPSKMLVYRPPSLGAKPSIRKIASCGNTFAALSSLGDVFTFSLDSGSTSATSSGGDGTSSPGYGSRLTPKTQRLWNVRRSFTSATDLDVGLAGSLIICTVSGHVFVRSRKFEGSSSLSKSGLDGGKGAGWKFSRVPYLQRVIKVAANSTAGFAAIRADVPLRFIEIEGPTLARDLLRILPHWARNGGPATLEVIAKQSMPRRAAGEDTDDEDDTDAIIERDIEVARRLIDIIRCWDLTWEVPSFGTDAVINVGALTIPVHKTVVSARSPVLAQHFATSRQFDLPCSPLTAFLLIHYLYSDDFSAVWDTRVGVPLRAALPDEQKATLQVGVIKSEFRQLALALDLPALAQALERQVKTVPPPTLAASLGDACSASATSKGRFSDSLKPDIVLRLADREINCHSAVLRARCPFFATFFDDADWSEPRRERGVVSFDFSHIDWSVMSVVLDHVYRDTGMSLFQTIERETAEEYIDFTVQVLAAANELLLDKLKQVCSAVLRSFGTPAISLLLAHLQLMLRCASPQSPCRTSARFCVTLPSTKRTTWPAPACTSCAWLVFPQSANYVDARSTQILVDGDGTRDEFAGRLADRSSRRPRRLRPRATGRQDARLPFRASPAGRDRQTPRLLRRDRRRASDRRRKAVSASGRAELAAPFSLPPLAHFIPSAHATHLLLQIAADAAYHVAKPESFAAGRPRRRRAVHPRRGLHARLGRVDAFSRRTSNWTSRTTGSRSSALLARTGRLAVAGELHAARLAAAYALATVAGPAREGGEGPSRFAEHHGRSVGGVGTAAAKLCEAAGRAVLEWRESSSRRPVGNGWIVAPRCRSSRLVARQHPVRAAGGFCASGRPDTLDTFSAKSASRTSSRGAQHTSIVLPLVEIPSSAWRRDRTCLHSDSDDAEQGHAGCAHAQVALRWIRHALAEL